MTVERYNEDVLGRRTLTFEYAVVGLPDLNAEAYEQGGEPLDVALASLMRSPRSSDRVERKYRSLTRIAQGDLDEARKLLLATIVQRYQRLTEDQEGALRERLRREKGTKDTMSIYELLREEGKELGIEQGIEQGVQQGLVQGQRRALLQLVRAKFGELPAETVHQIEAIDNLATLDGLLQRVLPAATLADMKIGDAVLSHEVSDAA